MGLQAFDGGGASEHLLSGLLGPIDAGTAAYKLTKGMGTVKCAAAGNGLMTAWDFMRLDI